MYCNTIVFQYCPALYVSNYIAKSCKLITSKVAKKIELEKNCGIAIVRIVKKYEVINNSIRRFSCLLFSCLLHDEAAYFIELPVYYRLLLI